VKRAAAMVFLACALAGCVADGPGPRRETAGPQPRGAVPAHLVVNIKDFVDTDRNGYLDSGTATVYLFADGYALPLTTTGTFDFVLTEPGGKSIAQWAITADQADACRIRSQVGPGYAFNLDLRPVGAEKTEQSEAVLIGQFTDTHGNTVRSGRLSVTVGPMR
jgi:hypothetical protein